MEWNGCTIEVWVDRWFHLTIDWASDYLAMLRLKLIHVSKRGHKCQFRIYTRAKHDPNCAQMSLNLMVLPWWRHQMETFSALLALCEEISMVTSEYPSQRPVKSSFDVFFDLCLNKKVQQTIEALVIWGAIRPPRCHLDHQQSFTVVLDKNYLNGLWLLRIWNRFRMMRWCFEG